MTFHASIFVIKRTGEVGSQFKMYGKSYTLGRASTCDIRVQLREVAEEHLKIIVDENGMVRAVLIKRSGLSRLLIMD